ncbi:MAG: metalloregulator ArsR/SmtB family transcription factor [Pseudomonadota bacterium]
MSTQHPQFRHEQTQALDALGNPLRRKIMELLAAKPHNVGELAQLLPVSRPAVSKHLQVLGEAGLVTHRASGASNVYSLEAAGFENARNWLDGFWNEALGRFRMVAENLPSNDPEQRS